MGEKSNKQEGREGLGNTQLTREMYPRDGRIGNDSKPSIFGFPSTASLTRRRISSSVRAKADILMPGLIELDDAVPPLLRLTLHNPPGVRGKPAIVITKVEPAVIPMTVG